MIIYVHTHTKLNEYLEQTGSGFIRVVKEGDEDGSDNNNQLQEGQNGIASSRMVHGVFRSNPATNDWVPRIDEDDRVYIGLDYYN